MGAVNINSVYLISETSIKQRSLINDSTLSYLIKPAIECAQKIGLVQLVGKALVDKLCYLVSTMDQNGVYLIYTDAYTSYKNLLVNQIRDYLVYKTMSEFIIPARDKMKNNGISMNQDNYYNQSDFEEATWTKRYWDDKADAFGKLLVDYLNDNADLYPEWKNSCCEGNNAHLVYDCGIVL